MPAVSAGLLLWRRSEAGLAEVLIAHPGGPFWKNKHEGAWSLPKGEFDPDDESPTTAAAREFSEELGSAAPDVSTWVDLGDTTLKSRKRILAWAAPGEFDVDSLVSNTFEMEWPPRSGKRIHVPEIDEIRWCSPDEAKRLLNPAQAVFVERLITLVGLKGTAPQND